MKKIFLDTNVVVDFLCKREPFDKDAVLLFNIIQDQKCKAYISMVTFTVLDYLISKQYSRTRTLKELKELRNLVDFLDVKKESGDFALTTDDFSDLEDAVQYHTAQHSHMDIIVTRNKKDFKNSELPVLAPDEALVILRE